QCRESGIDEALFDNQLEEAVPIDVVCADSSWQKRRQSNCSIKIMTDDRNGSGVQHVYNKEPQTNERQCDRQYVIESLFSRLPDLCRQPCIDPRRYQQGNGGPGRVRHYPWRKLYQRCLIWSEKQSI